MNERTALAAIAAGWVLMFSTAMAQTSEPRTAAPSRADAGDEAVELLSQYLKLDTTNPPGNEILAARYFKAIFDKEGIESRIYESAPGRASIYARLKGNGTKKAMVLLNHMDVVPADKRFWKEDPFSGLIKDGYVWGRGAYDMKGMGVIELMAMLQIKRAGIALKGDLIFLGTADEEAGGTMGAGYMVANHFDLFKDVGSVINEGGGGTATAEGKTLFVGVGVAEKSPLWLKVISQSEPGHGSTPRPDSSVNKLVRALARILAYQPPLDVSALVQRRNADLAHLAATAELREKNRDLRASLTDPTFANEFSKSIFNNAQVRNTIAVTMLEGSSKVNVIPPEAVAQLDVRLLPNQNPDEFLKILRAVISDDSLKVERTMSFPPSSSPPEGELPNAIRQVAAKYDPGVTHTIAVGNGFTDCHFFREKGVPCYGFQPYRIRANDPTGFHGNNERMSVENIKFGTAFMFDLVKRMVAE